MKREIRYKINEEADGITIEKFLKGKGYTRQSLVDLKKMDRNLLINDEWVFLNRKLSAGEELIVSINETDVSEKIPPVQLEFPIVYEDEDIVVVNKPYNMPIHPSLNNYENTLGNAAAYYYASKGEDFVFRCINRLDKDTSGLTILAKHQISAGILYDRMSRREIHREYIAIVEGDDLAPEGIVDAPIGRMPGSSIERFVDYENGEKAVTHYKVLDRRAGKTLVSLHLETGRTHQIRVHMKHIGHPLVGDWLYNPSSAEMSRQALHSYRLSFVHPITNENMEFMAELPDDMRKIIN